MSPQVPSAPVAGVPEPIPAGLLVLDVREEDEWEAGHVPGSWHVPLRELPVRYADLPQAEQVLVVCRVGSRSAYACAFLAQQGLDVVNLEGGLLAWQAAGRPLVTDDGAPATVA